MNQQFRPKITLSSSACLSQVMKGTMKAWHGTSDQGQWWRPSEIIDLLHIFRPEAFEVSSHQLNVTQVEAFQRLSAEHADQTYDAMKKYCYD